MNRYEVRAFGRDGEFRCGATLRASDDSSAIIRFRGLPLAGTRMELYRGKRRMTVRLEEDAAETSWGAKARAAAGGGVFA